MRARVRTAVVSTLVEAGLDARSWNELARASATNTIFQTFEWMRSWWKVFGERYEPRFVTASDGAAVIGVAPLVLTRGRWGRRVLRFLGDGRADYCDFLSPRGEPQVVTALLDSALGGSDWDVLELSHVRADSENVAIVRDYCRQTGRALLLTNHFGCPTLLIEGHEENAARVFNKASLRRRQNYFERTGQLSCRHFSTAAEVEPYLEAFFEQHVQRWARSTKGSLFNDSLNRVFYRELTANLDESGWLLFTAIEFNNRPIALHYGFDYDGTITWYKPAFDPEFSKHSPGLVLVRMLVGHAIALGRRELDFAVGDEEFKQRFTNARRTTVRIQVFRSASRFLTEVARHRTVAVLRRLRRAVVPSRSKAERDRKKGVT